MLAHGTVSDNMYERHSPRDRCIMHEIFHGSRIDMLRSHMFSQIM